MNSTVSEAHPRRRLTPGPPEFDVLYCRALQVLDRGRARRRHLLLRRRRIDAESGRVAPVTVACPRSPAAAPRHPCRRRASTASQYPRRVLQSEHKELETCHSKNAPTHRIGRSKSSRADEQFSAALGPKTNLEQKSQADCRTAQRDRARGLAAPNWHASGSRVYICGKPIGQSQHARWQRARKRACIENFRWHDIRHTWATWDRQSGTPTHELATLGWLAHFRMVERYAHLAPDHLAKAANRLDPLLAG